MPDPALHESGRLKPRWWRVYYALVVRPSAVVGRGLFSPLAIAARSKIGEFEGERIRIAEARRRAKRRSVIAIVELERHALDATRMTRGFRFINHSCDSNTYFRCTDTRAEIYARRDIAPGEELTVDYGESHHDGKLPCRCGAANCRGYI